MQSESDAQVFSMANYFPATTVPIYLGYSFPMPGCPTPAFYQSEQPCLPLPPYQVPYCYPYSLDNSNYYPISNYHPLMSAANHIPPPFPVHGNPSTSSDSQLFNETSASPTPIQPLFAHNELPLLTKMFSKEKTVIATSSPPSLKPDIAENNETEVATLSSLVKAKKKSRRKKKSAQKVDVSPPEVAEVQEDPHFLTLNDYPPLLGSQPPAVPSAVSITSSRHYAAAIKRAPSLPPVTKEEPVKDQPKLVAAPSVPKPTISKPATTVHNNTGSKKRKVKKPKQPAPLDWDKFLAERLGRSHLNEADTGPVPNVNAAEDFPSLNEVTNSSEKPFTRSADPPEAPHADENPIIKNVHKKPSVLLSAFSIGTSRATQQLRQFLHSPQKQSACAASHLLLPDQDKTFVQRSVLSKDNATQENDTEVVPQGAPPQLHSKVFHFRGKERERPAIKKLSRLKRRILDERRLRKESRQESQFQSMAVLQEERTNVIPVESVGLERGYVTDSELLKVQETDEKNTDDDEDVDETHKMTPKVAVPASSMRQGSRKHRAYCDHLPSPEVDAILQTCLRDLVRFQDRLHLKDPQKARIRRRYVLGLREVHKHLALKHVKFVIISTDMEPTTASDDAVREIVEECRSRQVPYVFSMTRRALAHCLYRKVPISAAAILDHSGTTVDVRKCFLTVEQLRRDYASQMELLNCAQSDQHHIHTG